MQNAVSEFQQIYLEIGCKKVGVAKPWCN